MSEQDKIYEMNLHESLTFEMMRIVRVPGGWIYESFTESGNGGYCVSSTFVPFHNEFMTVNKEG